MKDIDLIKQINNSIEYLNGEYESKKLWGSRPDGDVKFGSLMEWLGDEDNMLLLKGMIEVSKDIKKLKLS